MKKVCFLLTVIFISLSTSSQNNAGSLATQLVETKSIDDRFYFIYTLAEIKKDQLSATDQQSIEKILLQWYRDEPDPGIHSAIDYLFRHAKKGEVARSVNWNLAQELEKIDKQLQKKAIKNA